MTLILTSTCFTNITMLIIIIFFKRKLCSYLGPTLLSAIHMCLFLLNCCLIILIIQYERFK